MRSEDVRRISTGSDGLDAILRGGLPADRLYLLEGAPGSGKTTMALQFLLGGVKRGERALYVTLSESAEELETVASSHGWSLAEIDLFELASVEKVLGEGREQSILHPWEIELGGTVRLIQEQVEKVSPSRVVFDSLSEMRLLAHDALRYRRQVLALKQFFSGRNATVMLVDDLSPESLRDSHLHSICHGLITLERVTLEFGPVRRRLQVQKLRGVDFIAGYHDFSIRKGGLDVYPRLIAANHRTPFIGGPTPSGVKDLDAMMSGGPLRGTSVLLTGPAGAGKTTIAVQYVAAACSRGEPCTIFEFDERIATLLVRTQGMGIDLKKHVESGLLKILQIDPAEMAPGEFAWIVRREVEQRKVQMFVIDSLNGYLAAMPEEQQLVLQVHELLSYLNEQGVVTFLVALQTGLIGTTAASTLNLSYVSDAIILLRFFEAAGRIRKAISVIKYRGGTHEDTIRELRLDPEGLRVGPPLTDFRGVMTGTPEYVGSGGPLMEDRRTYA